MKDINEQDEEFKNYTGVLEGYAQGCMACRASLFKLGLFEKKYPEVTFCKMNLEKNTETAELLKVDALPVIAVFDNGNIVFYGTGICALKELESFLENKE